MRVAARIGRIARPAATGEGAHLCVNTRQVKQ